MQLLLLIVAAAWLALGSWLIFTYYVHPRQHRPQDVPIEKCTYHKVEAFVAPLGLRLDNGSVVQPGGIVLPAEKAAAERAAARLRELAPVGSDVYVEFDSGPPPEGMSPPPASIWLLPSGQTPSHPFPYEQAKLVGAVLVQEGLVRVDTDQLYFYRNEFILLQEDAERHHRGLWAGK
jgi:hypothetical protein